MRILELTSIETMVSTGSQNDSRIQQSYVVTIGQEMKHSLNQNHVQSETLSVLTEVTSNL